MKLHRDPPSALNTITAFGDGYLRINESRHERSLIVMPDRIVEGWGGGGFAALTSADFERVCALAPDVVLIGTGRAQRFPAAATLRPLIDARIGFEVMDSAAACRTYNILMSEGRRVAAALLIETTECRGSP
jgi:uncharacterized protein